MIAAIAFSLSEPGFLPEAATDEVPVEFLTRVFRLTPNGSTDCVATLATSTVDRRVQLHAM